MIEQMRIVAPSFSRNAFRWILKQGLIPKVDIRSEDSPGINSTRAKNIHTTDKASKIIENIPLRRNEWSRLSKKHDVHVVFGEWY
jgi:hypothetical protein